MHILIASSQKCGRQKGFTLSCLQVEPWFHIHAKLVESQWIEHYLGVIYPEPLTFSGCESLGMSFNSLSVLLLNLLPELLSGSNGILDVNAF